MKHNCTHHNDFEDVSVSSVHRLKVDGFSVTKSMIKNKKGFRIKSRCKVDGYDFEIQLLTGTYHHMEYGYWVALKLVYLGAPCDDDGVAVHLMSCRLVTETASDDLLPLPTIDMPRSVKFKRPLDPSPRIYFARGMVRDDLQAPGSQPINGGSFTVECTTDVRSRRDPNSVSRPPPSSDSDLHKHLGELLQNQSGVDVTFVVSGESISAHKTILAARSPIFMAEFFGNMLERSSQCVEIQDIHPTVFKAMLHFIYTDKAPELDNNSKETPAETAQKTVMAQHLLVAADKYGLDRLKEICEERLTLGIGIGTVASTLALADQHNFTKLKAKCIDYISGSSSKDLDAILETEGYRHLEASNPSVLTELLKAVHGKKRKRWMDS